MAPTEKDGPRVETGNTHGVPFLFCSGMGDPPRPLVVVSHPFGASKAMWAGQLAELAGLGYSAVALDNRGHGEREGPPFKAVALVDRNVDVRAVRVLIKETADEIPRLLDTFLARGGIDAARIALVGVSMGGFITFRALATDSRIRVAATAIASPYWDDIPEDMPALTSPEAREALESYSREHSPAQHLDRFYPRALLIQIGQDDVHFNQQRVLEFHRELEPYYRAAPDKLKLVVHKGTRHEFTGSMWENVKAWLQIHL